MKMKFNKKNDKKLLISVLDCAVSSCCNRNSLQNKSDNEIFVKKKSFFFFSQFANVKRRR